MANYSITNFVATPSGDDTMMRIYDKNTRLKYTLEPNVAYFSAKLNIVTIRVEDDNTITLDFPNSTEAIKALAKLNEFRKFFDKPTEDASGIILYTGNKDMVASVTNIDGDLACSISISATPKKLSIVSVYVNGLNVNVGGKLHPYDCYFSTDGGLTAKSSGHENIGDKLYWNPSIANYNLDANDLIDFVYLTVP